MLKNSLPKLLTFLAMLLAQSSWAMDTYNPVSNELSIPAVQVGNRTYTQVVVKVGNVLEVQNGTPANAIDVYDPVSGVLHIASVGVGNSTYTNVRITVGPILSVGGYELNTYSVSTNPNLINYPSSYTRKTVSELDYQTDPCNLNLDVVTYPSSWMGQYKLPEIVGAPLKPKFGRGMYLKDIMLSNNPNFVLQGAPDAPEGCFKGSLKSEFAKTISRLKALGVQYVYAPQWHWMSKRYGAWYVGKAEASFGPLSDDDLSFFVKTAHAAGMKVIMKNQIQGMVDNIAGGPAYVPPANMQNYKEWFSAFKPYMVERAAFFQALGIDIWELGCGNCLYGDTGDNSLETVQFFAQNLLDVHSQISGIYKGSLMLSDSPLLYTPSTAKIRDVIDYITVSLAREYTDTGKLSVQDYKEKAFNKDSILFYDGYGKTLILEFGIQSRSNALSLPGYMEETACTASLNNLNVSDTECIQKQTTPNFSLQAIVYEALLEGINALEFKSKAILAPGEYWETDSLIPQTAFPNLAASPRNKPAEGILKAWYKN